MPPPITYTDSVFVALTAEYASLQTQLDNKCLIIILCEQRAKTTLAEVFDDKDIGVRLDFSSLLYSHANNVRLHRLWSWTGVRTEMTCRPT